MRSVEPATVGTTNLGIPDGYQHNQTRQGRIGACGVLESTLEIAETEAPAR